MVIEAAELRSRFTADTSQLEGAMKRSGGLLDGFASKVGHIAEIATGIGIAHALEDVPGKLMEMVNAAAEDEAAMTRLHAAVDNTTGGWSQYGGEVSKAIEEGGKLAFSHEATANALTLLTSETGSSSEAINRLSSAQNLARGTGMDLGAASKLLGKLTDQNVKVLGRYGITVAKGATAQDLLNKVDARFGGQAGKFAATAAGQWDVAKIQMHEVGIQIGGLLLPAFTRLAGFIAGTVAPLLSTLVTIVGGALTRAFDSISAVLRGPLIKAFTVVKDAVSGFIGYLRGDAIGGMNAMQHALNAVFGGETATKIVAWATLIGDQLTTAFTDVKNAAQTFIGALQGDWVNAPGIDRLSTLFGMLGTIITGTVLPAVETLAGVVSGVFATAWVIVQNAAETFIGALQGNWVDAPGIDKVSQLIGSIGVIISRDVLPAVHDLIGAVPAMISLFGALAPVLDPLLTLVGGLVKNWGDLLTVLSPWSSFLSQFIVLWGDQGLMGAIAGIPGILQNIGGSFATIGTIFAGVGKDIGIGLLDSLKRIDWGAVGGAFMTALGAALSVAGTLGTKVVTAIGTALGSVNWSATAQIVGGALITALGTALSAAGTLATSLAGAIGGALGSVDWSATAGTVGQAILTALSTATGLVWDAAAWLGGIVAGASWGTIATTIGKGIIAGLVQLTGLTWDAAAWLVGTLAGVSWTAIATAIGKGILSGLGTAAGVTWDAAKWVALAMAGTDWGAVAHSIANGIGEVLSKLADAGAWVYGWIQTGVGSVNWTGLATSIAGGIGSVWGSLKSAATYIYDWIAGGIDNVDWAGLGGTISGDLGTALDTTSKQTGTSNTALLSMAAALATIVGTLALLPGPLSELGTGFAALGTAIEGVYLELVTAPEIFGGLVAVLGGPVTVAIAAVVALLAAFGLAYATNFLGTADATNTVAGGIATAFTSIMTAIQPFTDIIGPNLLIVWDSIKTALTDVGTAVTGATPLWTQLGLLWTNIQTVAVALAPVLETIGRIVGTVLLVYVTALSQELAILAPILGGALVVAANLAIGALTSIVAYINLVITFWTNVVKIVTDLVHGDWSKAWADAKQLVADLVTGVEGILSGLPATVAGYIATLASDVLGKLQGLSADAQGAIQGMADAIIGKVGSLVGSVQGFFSDMAATVTGTVSGWVGDVVQAAIDLYTQFTTEIGSLYDAVTSKISQMVADTISFVAGLPGSIRDALGDLYTIGYDAIAGLANGIIDAGASLVAGAIQTVTDMIPAWMRSALKMFSPSKVMMAIGEDVMAGFTIGIIDGSATTAKAAADAASAVISAFNAALDLGAKIQSGGLTLPSVGATDAFGASVSSMITSLAATADQMKSHALAAAKAFADAANGVVSFVSAGVDALSKLVDFIRPSDQAISDFKFAVEHLVQSFADSGQLMSVDAVANAKLFSDAATAAVAVLKDGIDGLAALADFVRPSDEAIASFKFAVEKLVQSFADSGAVMSQDGIAAATTFSSAVQSAVATLKDGVTGLSALTDWVRPTDQVISDFKFAVEKLVQSLADSGLAMGTDGMTAAQNFATAVSACVGVVSDAITAFAALGNGLVAPSQEALGQFRTGIEAIVQLFEQSGQYLQGDGLTAATNLATAGKAIFDTVNAGISAMTALGTGSLPTTWNANLDAFGSFMFALVRRLGVIGKRIGDEGLAAAKTFAESGKAVFDMVSSAVTGLTALGSPDFVLPNNQKMKVFEDFITQVVTDVGAVAVTIKDALDPAKTFADTGKAIFDLLNTASNFSGLPDLGKHFADNLHTFLDNVKLAIDDLIALGDEIGAGLDTATAIAEKISKIVGLLGSGTGGGGGAGSGGGGGGGTGGGGAGTGIGQHEHWKGQSILPGPHDVIWSWQGNQWGWQHPTTGGPPPPGPVTANDQSALPLTLNVRVFMDSQEISARVEQDISDGIRLHPAPVGGSLVGAV